MGNHRDHYTINYRTMVIRNNSIRITVGGKNEKRKSLQRKN